MCKDLENQPLIMLGFDTDSALEFAIDKYTDIDIETYLNNDYTSFTIPSK